MTITIQTWIAKCITCGNPITGRDVFAPGKERDRQHDHDDPDHMYLDIPGTGGAHTTWPDETTLQITKTTTL